MARILEGCVVKGGLSDPLSGFTEVESSLRYQCNALGMQWAPETEESKRNSTAFTLLAPRTSPISCDIYGWGRRTQSVATEFLVQAASGLMSVHGRASGKPQMLGINYVSTLTATLALQGTLAAAIGELRGMAVSQVSVSLASSALLSVGQYIAGATAADLPERILPGSTSTVDRPPFISADGIVFELETLDAMPWRAFWSEVGVDTDSAGRGWNGFMLRYAKAISPIPTVLMRALAEIPYARIAAICNRNGMSICPVRTLDERSRDDDAHAMWNQGPWTFRCEAFQSNGNKPGETAARDQGNELPLSGITVIESCRRVQGPLAGHLLALLGATVIRIEPPGGDPLRGMPPMVGGVSARFDALNRLKTVREIDIKSRDGQAEIHELVRQADVFLHNWAPGKAAPLNLDFADLRSINPMLVYAYAGGWGANDKHGLPGTDFMVQAYSGIAEKIATNSGNVGGSLFTVLDVLGGAVAAQGITAALLNRCLYHGGVAMESSLLGAANLLCANGLGNRFESDPADGVSDQAENSVLKATYPTMQGMIAIECGDITLLNRLQKAIRLSAGLDVQSHLPEILLRKTAQEWLAIFMQHDVPAAMVVEDLTDLLGDSRINAELTNDEYTRVNSPWRFE